MWAYTYQGVEKKELAWAVAEQLHFICKIKQLYHKGTKE